MKISLGWKLILVIVIYQCIFLDDASSEVKDYTIDACYIKSITDILVELDGVGSLTCGQSVEFSQIGRKPPKITYKNAVSKWYTLIMVDPDASSSRHPHDRYWLHWIVSIEGQKLLRGTDGNEYSVVEYNPPSAEAYNGRHRYQFFLYEHDYISTYIVPSKRSQFDPREYAESYLALGNVRAQFQFVIEHKPRGVRG
ncbi:protein D2-like [Anneissia japonica]|uniref:protein D2-like n=1 Tax=Anneissia japonica TaxID=1529436 RepID=UPI00142568E0|nr:protein D2-like [Anneissia japonica]